MTITDVISNRNQALFEVSYRTERLFAKDSADVSKIQSQNYEADCEVVDRFAGAEIETPVREGDFCNLDDKVTIQ